MLKCQMFSYIKDWSQSVNVLFLTHVNSAVDVSCRSVAACEAIVKKLYTLIGWEDDDVSGGGKMHKYAFGIFVPTGNCSAIFSV